MLSQKVFEEVPFRHLRSVLTSLSNIAGSFLPLGPRTINGVPNEQVCQNAKISKKYWNNSKLRYAIH